MELAAPALVLAVLLAAVAFPPTPASQLQPPMPNVCAVRELTIVGHQQPCVQAFTRMVKVWKQGCGRQMWCVGYERRTGYYTDYRQVYSMEYQTVYKCCPGWYQLSNDEGCLYPVCNYGVCFNGGNCVEGSAQLCHCPPGFQGPRCQYDVNECEVENGGCESQCCNTIGSFYCKCPEGQKLRDDRKACEGRTGQGGLSGMDAPKGKG
ncbi:multiple epidermal growth factor-like domains protein 6 [Monodelphis domestica]|uniref:multiple epidermal growth factor-like domains protein 6 n=1 Tax=Monodelphis domestica TaxID=13616 RepID=UPI0024E1F2D9|nr:multiple epidermal growth factor-like domains protein 6 [Monodelphis domestica]